MLLLQPGLFFPQSRRMYYLPITIIMLRTYQFVYLCDSRYVGRTLYPKCCKSALNNMFSGRSESIILHKIASIFPVPARKTAFLGQHLLKNPSYASQYSDIKFSILARGRTSFHLSALEATFIKSFQPNLCRHKEFLYSLKLIN